MHLTIVACGLVAAVGACRPAPHPDRVAVTGAPPAESSAPGPDTVTPSFVNRVWKVGRSSGVEPGTFYVFLSDGTLLIASSHGTPALGRWRHAGDSLTLVEEGLPHVAAIVKLAANEFAIRLREGGTPLDITFVPGVAP